MVDIQLSKLKINILFSCPEKGRKTEPCPKNVPIFQSLSNEEILKVAKMNNHIQFQKGQMLIQEKPLVVSLVSLKNWN